MELVSHLRHPERTQHPRFAVLDLLLEGGDGRSSVGGGGETYDITSFSITFLSFDLLHCLLLSF